MVSRWPQSAFASINFSAVINVVSHRWEREKIESELCLIEWQTNKRWRRENMFLFLAGRQPTISATGRVCPLQLYSPRTPCNFVFFLVLGWFGTATQRLWSCVPVKAALGANTAEQQGGHLFKKKKKSQMGLSLRGVGSYLSWELRWNTWSGGGVSFAVDFVYHSLL